MTTAVILTLLLTGLFALFVIWSIFGKGHAWTCKIFLLAAAVLLTGITWKFPPYKDSNPVISSPAKTQSSNLVITSEKLKSVVVESQTGNDNQTAVSQVQSVDAVNLRTPQDKKPLNPNASGESLNTLCGQIDEFQTPTKTESSMLTGKKIGQFHLQLWADLRIPCQVIQKTMCLIDKPLEKKNNFFAVIKDDPWTKKRICILLITP